MSVRFIRRPAAAIVSTLTAAALAATALLTGAGPAAAVRGGGPARTDARPYAMLIELADGSQFCGGTLIAPTKVLTAGHCVRNADDPMTLLVIGGRTRLSDTGGTVRHVASYRVDPGWSPGTAAHDGAVITLKRPMPYRTLPPAGPKDAALYADGRTATVLGWAGPGRTPPAPG